VGPSPAFLRAPSQSLFTSDEIISNVQQQKRQNLPSRTQTVQATAVH
jgi:hypothetical protein